jgi:hypothetical protein
MWECYLVQPLWKSVWRFIKKLKIELSYESAIPLSGTPVPPKQTKTKKPKNWFEGRGVRGQ